KPGSGRLHLSGCVAVREAQERVATEGAVVARQLGARRKVVARGGVRAESQTGRIVAVVEKARVGGAHDRSPHPADWQVSIFQNEIPQDLVLRQLVDDVIEASAKCPNNRTG